MTARDHDEKPREKGETPEDRPGEVGAEGGAKSARRSQTPFTPDREDDSALGDTDQHSEG